jgi:multiple sugar transport system substrate-binding protein
MTEDGQVSVYCDENREAVAFLSRLGEEGCLYPPAAGMTASETFSAFLNGEFCFLITSPAKAEANYDTASFEIGVAEPITSPSGEVGGFFSANNIMIYANSEHKGAAKEFLKYWSANELTMFTQGTASGIPVRSEFYEDPYYSDSRFLTMAFNEFIPIGGNAIWRMTSNFPEANELDGLTEWAALAQGITLGEDADALLKAVDDAAREVMGQ